MRFLETVFRHRLLAVLPLVLGIAVGFGFQLAQPRAFTATASVWVDQTAPGNGMNNTTNQYVNPSVVEQSEMQQMLTTRAFAVAVGRSGQLTAYLRTHPRATATGLAAVPVAGGLLGGAKGSLDDQVAADLPGMVSLTASGPQVVNITVTAPTPEVAAGTTEAFIHQFTDQIVAALKAGDQVAVRYYGQQVAQAEALLQKDQRALSDYLKAHPSVPVTGAGDATATTLSQAVTLDTTTYQSLLSRSQQAQLNLANVTGQTGFRVIDAPTAGGSPVSIKGKLLGAGVAGLVVGLLVSVLIMSVLTAVDRSARRAGDVRRALGLEVAASIALLPPERHAGRRAGET